jgi:hypothetical protein
MKNANVAKDETVNEPIKSNSLFLMTPDESEELSEGF